MLLMFDQLAAPSSDDCHRMTLPVCPLSINVPLLALEQTVAAPETDPPTERGLTVMVATVAIVEGQVPFVTVALYIVVVVKFE